MAARLEGKRAIVTGGAQGIGGEFGRALAGEGAAVAVWDIDPDDTVAKEISAVGGRALHCVVDVSDEASVRAAMAATLSGLGGIDILVNNGALFTRLERKAFDAIDVEEWDRVSAVNIRGPWLCAKHTVPEMRKAGGGKIVNISSSRALKGKGFLLHYDASKAAILGITRSLARELGDDNICVNAIAPGLTMSENVKKRTNWQGGGAAETVATRALKRDQQPQDLVGAMLFLVSGDSDFMTGQTLVVDGGGVMN
jgi:NAD(P)-dependent dehydrogenase (short-subunit alcohol dehydrogenase family)